jgi:hypothetical protein
MKLKTNKKKYTNGSRKELKIKRMTKLKKVKYHKLGLNDQI